MGVHSQIESAEELVKFHRGDTLVDTGTLRRIVEGEVLDVEELLEPLQSTESHEIPLRLRLGLITKQSASTAVVGHPTQYWRGTDYVRHRHHQSALVAWLMLPLGPVLIGRRLGTDGLAWLGRSMVLLIAQVAKLDVHRVRSLPRIAWTKLLRIIARYRVARYKTEWGLVVKRKLAVKWSRRVFALGCGMTAFSTTSLLVVLTTPWFTPGIVIGSALGMAMAFGAGVVLDTIAETADMQHFEMAMARTKPYRGAAFWATTQTMPSAAPGRHRAAVGRASVPGQSTEEPAA